MHHHGTKEAWEELHWDQDMDRWVGARRDEPPRPHRQDTPQDLDGSR
ncbi:MAG: hypothetical protein QOI63_365 [Thermoplasmata archaeon]|jgi:hypothetical protein|nr:hypothetical protein [Thermoplasmata archaeon]